MKIAIFAYSHGGCAAARRVRAVLAEAETVCYAVPRLEEAGFLPLAKDIYRERFSSMDALIFIGACGIAVREIAPYLVSKKTDPAVLCIDEKMQFVIPLLSGLTALLSSIISMKNSPNMGQAGASMKMMMYIMPLISIWFTFMVPIGVGIYWTLSNVFGCVQSLVLNKIYNPKEVAEKLQAEAKERAERERQERIEAKKRAKEALKNGEKVEDTTYLSDKEKIKEARRRYAEKYGDEYIDD